jgi:hypothetical protein
MMLNILLLYVLIYIILYFLNVYELLVAMGNIQIYFNHLEVTVQCRLRIGDHVTFGDY